MIETTRRSRWKKWAGWTLLIIGVFAVAIIKSWLPGFVMRTLRSIGNWLRMKFDQSRIRELLKPIGDWISGWQLIPTSITLTLCIPKVKAPLGDRQQDL